MPQQEYDKGSKWLLEHHGDAVLALAGVRGLREWRAVQPETTQPRQLPDGLLRVVYAGRTEPSYVLIEVATYPEPRVLGQALDDLTLVHQRLGALPDLLVVNLWPKGKYRLPDRHTVTSPRGWSHLGVGWKVVEVWQLAAEDLLAANDVGLIPWVPLTQFDESPEAMLTLCRKRIEEGAPPREAGAMLEVTKVLAGLKFPSLPLLKLLTEGRTMIDSPVYKWWAEEISQKVNRERISDALAVRFGSVPESVTERLDLVLPLDVLESLFREAVRCPDLERFQAALEAALTAKPKEPSTRRPRKKKEGP